MDNEQNNSSAQGAQYNMISQQLRARDVLDDHLLNIIEKTPREKFVPSQFRDFAYADMAIDIGHEEKMLRPSEEGLILQALDIKPSDTILEVGTGSGYFTALLSQLGKYVYSVDIRSDFTTKAKTKLEQMRLHNFTLETGDAAQGWDTHAPYDVIVITGSLPFLPKRFCELLSPQGRLFAILGKAPVMEAVLIEADNGNFNQQLLFETNVNCLQNALQKEQFVF